MAGTRTKRRKGGLSSTAAMIGLTLLIGFIAAVVYVDARDMRSQQQSYIMREMTLERQIEEEKQRTLLLTEQKKHTQTKQYVDWFEKNRVKKDKKVYGIIVLNSPKKKLIEKVRADNRIRLYEYQIAYREIT